MLEFVQIFFKRCVIIKAYPLEMFLILQILTLVFNLANFDSRAPQTKKKTQILGQVRSEKWVGGGPFCKIFKNCFEIFLT